MSRRCWRRGVGLLGGLGIGWFSATWALAQWVPAASDAENQAIAYSATRPADAIAALQQALDSGEAELRFDARVGYLASVLEALRVPADSQTLVFSRTSFQRALISPARPRALYFSRDVYVGWVRGGSVLEIASIDPALGPVFYTLDQQNAARPRFRRQTRACLQCHDSLSSTGGVPGLIVKSVHVDAEGEPIVAAGTSVTNDRSPMNERWGGWYVTGRHGGQPHRGVDPGAAVDTAPYPGAGSELGALTVLAHQTHLQNLLTRLGYRTRMALYFDRQRNADEGRSADYVPDTTKRVIESVAEPFVRAMLFADAAALDGPVPASSGFIETFARGAPRDRRGRSLFELDLTRGLLRYPCSYLIYSPAFDALPPPAREYVFRRLGQVLSGRDTSQAFAHLTRTERTAILEILLDTKPEFAAYAQ